MITAQEDVRHLAASEDARSREMGVVETAPAFEGLRVGGAVVPEHPRDEAGDRLDHAERRELAARKHEVPDRDFFPLRLEAHPLVDAFVASGEEEDPHLPRQAARGRLAERRARRREEDLVERSLARLQPIDAVEDRLGLQDHPWTSAKRTIIDGAVSVPGEVPEV